MVSVAVCRGKLPLVSAHANQPWPLSSLAVRRQTDLGVKRTTASRGSRKKGELLTWCKAVEEGVRLCEGSTAGCLTEQRGSLEAMSCKRRSTVVRASVAAKFAV